MNIVFNKCIFIYLCFIYTFLKYLYEFQSIFINFRYTDILLKIFTDILPIFLIYSKNSSTNISVFTDILILAPIYPIVRYDPNFLLSSLAIFRSISSM